MNIKNCNFKAMIFRQIKNVVFFSTNKKVDKSPNFNKKIKLIYNFYFVHNHENNNNK